MYFFFFRKNNFEQKCRCFIFIKKVNPFSNSPFVSFPDFAISYSNKINKQKKGSFVKNKQTNKQKMTEDRRVFLKNMLSYY